MQDNKPNYWQVVGIKLFNFITIGYNIKGLLLGFCWFIKNTK